MVFSYYTVIIGLFNSNQTRSFIKNRGAPSVFASPFLPSQYIFSVIDTDAKLDAFLPTLKSAAWLALDTEADSLHAYPEKVCLIQISTAAGDELIDPLAKTNLDPLLDALAGHELIMHGADYDLRLFRKHHEFVPRAIFDTMLAARLLGERQFGLSSLVEKFLGVKLDKASQKADWARRPLTERMETYARNDTHHLKPLSDKLKLELQNKNRLGWHQESCARLIEECSQPPVVDGDSVWRVKGSHVLNRHALAGHELIMHGADYDLRLFRKHHQFVPRAIFDTMLAARLLGERQFGLSSLAEKFLGVKLDKASQKAD